MKARADFNKGYIPPSTLEKATCPGGIGRMIGKIPDLTVASSGVNADPCACRSYFCATGVVCLDWRQSCTVFLSVVLQTLRIQSSCSRHSLIADRPTSAVSPWKKQKQYNCRRIVVLLPSRTIYNKFSWHIVFVNTRSFRCPIAELKGLFPSQCRKHAKGAASY